MASCSEARSRSPQTRPGRPPPPSVGTAFNSLSAIKQHNERARNLIEQGLSSDEQGKADEARTFYQNGLQAVNAVLGVDCEKISGSAEDKDAAKNIQQKLNKTKLQIEYRLEALKPPSTAPTAPAPEAMDCEEPPSYEATMSMSDSQFAALGDSIMSGEESDGQSVVPNATEIFSIRDGVQIFFITPEGYVSAPSYPSALKIFRFNESEAGPGTSQHPSAFLQVGDWFYPLQPGSSPALQSNYGAYIFPDVDSQVPGSAVGLMLPDTVQPGERQQFEQMMHTLTMILHQQPSPVEPTAPEETPAVVEPEAVVGEEKETTSTKISKGILIAAEYISWGVGKGAEKAGELIKHGSTKLRARLHPEQQPRTVDPRLQTGVHYVRKGSHTAVRVSGYIVKKLGEATMYLAKEAAPHIKREGSRLLPKSMKPSSTEGKSTVDSVVEVAASGLQGFGTIYMSLETAAKALGKSLANETVDVVSHKYGSEAGKLTENMLYTGGNLAMTAHNANNLGVKAVAKRAAKDTGKAVLQEINKKKDGGGQGASGQGQPGQGQSDQGGKGEGGQPPEKPPPPGSAGQKGNR